MTYLRCIQRAVINASGFESTRQMLSVSTDIFFENFIGSAAIHLHALENNVRFVLGQRVLSAFDQIPKQIWRRVIWPVMYQCCNIHKTFGDGVNGPSKSNSMNLLVDLACRVGLRHSLVAFDNVFRRLRLFLFEVFHHLSSLI